MIFVTVGTQLAFDRLIRAVDEWAADRDRDDVFAQIGPAGYLPRRIGSAAFISPDECRERMASATLIVAHAGMGTIIGALELGKPVVVLPRQAALGEHRNDHQLATARRLGALGHVTVADDEQQLVAALDRVGALSGGAPIPRHASSELLDAVSAFISG